MKLLEKTTLIKTMHFIAVVMVLFFLIMTVYQSYEINVQLRKKLIADQVYERLVTVYTNNIKELVGYVIIYFFGREVGKKEHKDLEQKQE